MRAAAWPGGRARRNAIAEVQPVTSDRPNLPATPTEMVDAWLKAATDAERRWNEFFNQAMGTDAFAQMLARSSEQATAAQTAFARSIEQHLRTLNIPTQSDLAAITERLTALERRLDALAATNDDE
jgi:hypothetical protein